MAESILRQFRNSFEGGLDTDTTVSLLKPNTYNSAQNVSLVTNGKFFSLTNILGTTDVGALPGTSGTVKIIGVFNNIYQYASSGLSFKGLTIFGYDSVHFKIWAFNTEANLFYELYAESIVYGTTHNTDYLIDAVSYAESGYDNIYFTDNLNEPRKIKCIIPNPYSANFLTNIEIGLPQRKALGKISGIPISGNGSLLTGTYQLAYQLIDVTNNKYTRFSLLCNPIHIYTSDTVPKAGVGLPSTSYISSSIILTDDEYTNYTHFRIAVVSNIYAEGASIETLNSVGLSKIELISDYYGGVVGGFNTISNYNITSNALLSSTTIDEIVVDLLALDHAKTLNIKRNRLLLGNVTLKDLSYDNGNPSISGGSILQKSHSTVGFKDMFTDPQYSSFYRGYYRGEVYRYAISYFDKWGNFSSPKTIDVSSVQDNQISGAIDMKFPDRSFNSGGRYYTVLNTSDQTISLGLQLTSITNHPTWAAGFIILRSKRKKNIQFQTPFLPMAHVFGLGANGNYPTTTYEPPYLSPTTKNYTSATPMGPDNVILPCDLIYGAPVEIGDKGYSADNFTAGTAYNYTYRGEPSHLYFTPIISHAMIYPPDSMYTKLSQYIFSGNESFQTIDAMLCRWYFNYFDYPALEAGVYHNEGPYTNYSASFFTVKNNSIHYENGLTPVSALRSSTTNISGNKFFDNLSAGTSLNGRNILDSSKLNTPTITFGYPFNNQKCTVIELATPLATLNSPATTTLTFSDGGPTFNQNHSTDNYSLYNLTFIPFNATSGLITTPLVPAINSTRRNAIEIINILSNLKDTRYGAENEQNEFIFTGTQVNFTVAEQTTISGGGSVVPKTVDIWGGDCFVSYHTFKVNETTWSVCNPEKLSNTTFTNSNLATPNTAVSIYERAWVNNTTDKSFLHVPYFNKNAAQYITLPLESEYIGSVRDIDTPDVVTTQNSIPIYGAASETKARAPMGYNYNINLKKENDQKIFIPLDKNIPVISKFKARVYYSDLKIYQSAINGFDVFRVNNLFDYEERYGGITKLALGGDNLYGIQEKSIFYIPINERVMETTDASQLAVRTSDFISQPLYLTNNKGSQHIQSVIQQGQFVICMDNINKQVYRIQGQQFDIISDKGMISKWQNLLSTSIDENKITSLYDVFKDEYWLMHKDATFCYLWNNDYNIWTSNFSFPNTGLSGGACQNGQLFLIGGLTFGGVPHVHTMYTNNAFTLFGNSIPSRISFIINPELEHSKVFDNMDINSTGRMNYLSMSTDFGGTSSVDLSTLTTRGMEGGYMVKALRTTSPLNARVRGLYATVFMDWLQAGDSFGVGGPQVGLISVITNTRLSSKTF